MRDRHKEIWDSTSIKVYEKSKLDKWGKILNEQDILESQTYRKEFNKFNNSSLNISKKIFNEYLSLLLKNNVKIYIVIKLKHIQGIINEEDIKRFYNNLNLLKNIQFSSN